MTAFFFLLWVISTVAIAFIYLLKQRADTAAAAAREEGEAAKEESQRVVAATQRTLEEKTALLTADFDSAIAYAQKALEDKLAEIAAESDRIRRHYEKEAMRVHYETTQRLDETLAELAPLRGYAHLQDAEAEVRKTLAEAITEATSLQQEAEILIAQTKEETLQERAFAHQRAKEIREQAITLLTQASRDAGKIVEAAEMRAAKIGGDAYVALRDKQVLEEAVAALWNIVEGYGDRYVVPTRSLLDELAVDFGHTQAGEELRAAREQSRRLVELHLAAACNYEEPDRRERANRFVVDAFNGRVDAILSRTKYDNFGTLDREIKDAFSIVNLNGLAFRDARVLPAYLDARLAELKWGVILQELKQKEREEQRALQERIREEEKARREYERAIQEADREEAAIRQAMDRARLEAQHAGAAERAKLEAELAALNLRLAEAEARGQRALSMAQQTRSGNVYIISNVGSFGDNVLKIGLTRRLVPEDRVKELGDASVPFSFDIHAMIKSDDAPTLERMLHKAFQDARINKVNHRKEFFRLPLERVRAFAIENGLEATFTLAAEAREYRETIALEKMTPEERDKYLQRIESEEVLEADFSTAFEEVALEGKE